MTITFEDLAEYVGYVVDDAGSAGPLGSDKFKEIRYGNSEGETDCFDEKIPVHRSRLVGWQCGFEPMVVSVHSYLDVRISDEDAVDLATDYLDEIGWFSDGIKDPDYLI